MINNKIFYGLIGMSLLLVSWADASFLNYNSSVNVQKKISENYQQYNNNWLKAIIPKTETSNLNNISNNIIKSISTINTKNSMTGVLIWMLINTI